MAGVKGSQRGSGSICSGSSNHQSSSITDEPIVLQLWTTKGKHYGEPCSGSATRQPRCQLHECQLLPSPESTDIGRAVKASRLPASCIQAGHTVEEETRGTRQSWQEACLRWHRDQRLQQVLVRKLSSVICQQVDEEDPALWQVEKGDQLR